MPTASPYQTAVQDPETGRWRLIDANGYARLYDEAPSPRNYTRFQYEHRKAMADLLGRSLLLKELVHHIDSNRSNNAPENLKLMADHLEHIRQEHPEWRIKKPVNQNPPAIIPVDSSNAVESAPIAANDVSVGGKIASVIRGYLHAGRS
jgi:hypothetical protein